MHLAGQLEEGAWSPQDLVSWWDAIKDHEGAREQATLLFSLLDALGATVPAELWADLLEGPQRATVALPRPAVWFRLESAAAEGRTGETVLLALLALGEGGPAQSDPLTLHHVLANLDAINLTAEARALAIEAALAASL
jgi:hypothetical protein